MGNLLILYSALDRYHFFIIYANKFPCIVVNSKFKISGLLLTFLEKYIILLIEVVADLSVTSESTSAGQLLFL